MWRRPVGRIPLKTRLFFPPALVANSRLLFLVAFVYFVHFCFKSSLEALYELEPFERLFGCRLNRSSVKHRRHGLAPVRVGVIQSSVDCVGPPIGVPDWLNQSLQGHFGGFQQAGIFLRVSFREDNGHRVPPRGNLLKPLHELSNSVTSFCIVNHRACHLSCLISIQAPRRSDASADRAPLHRRRGVSSL